MSQELTAPRRSEARERLLTTAGTIFYAAGIHSVGVERIVAEAKVTRATFYRHFPSKEDLVTAYLVGVDQGIRDQMKQAVASGAPAAAILKTIGRRIAAEIKTPGFRGCAFLNAAAEYPDPGHQVHQAVLTHRDWFQNTITGLFAQTTVTPPETAGRHYVMLRDGAMSAGWLGDAPLAGQTLIRGIEALLARQ